MSEVSRRVKAGTIILGVLAGLALVILPGIAAPKTVAQSSDGSIFNGLSSTPSPSIAGLSSTTPSPVVPVSRTEGLNLLIVAIGILIIVGPAGVFSLYMRRWAIRRAKAYWPETED